MSLRTCGEEAAVGGTVSRCHAFVVFSTDVSHTPHLFSSGSYTHRLHACERHPPALVAQDAVRDGAAAGRGLAQSLARLHCAHRACEEDARSCECRGSIYERECLRASCMHTQKGKETRTSLCVKLSIQLPRWERPSMHAALTIVRSLKVEVVGHLASRRQGRGRGRGRGRGCECGGVQLRVRCAVRLTEEHAQAPARRSAREVVARRTVHGTRKASAARPRRDVNIKSP